MYIKSLFYINFKKGNEVSAEVNADIDHNVIKKKKTGKYATLLIQSTFSTSVKWTCRGQKHSRWAQMYQ